ncbi:MAG: hypothetical protein ABJA18_14330 [bacterium]
MKKRVLKIVVIILTVLVLQTAARIEVLNMRAGNYLPRRDRNLVGASDGKWRISQENTPRDQLRNLVQTLGLAQYVLAPLLLMLGIADFLKSKGSWARAAAVSGVFVATMAISLMLYRQYYQSLGY